MATNAYHHNNLHSRLDHNINATLCVHFANSKNVELPAIMFPSDARMQGRIQVYVLIPLRCDERRREGDTTQCAALCHIANLPLDSEAIT